MIDGLERPREVLEQTREYVMDMLEQLADLADQAGDNDLALAVRSAIRGTKGVQREIGAD